MLTIFVRYCFVLQVVKVKSMAGNLCKAPSDLCLKYLYYKIILLH